MFAIAVPVSWLDRSLALQDAGLSQEESFDQCDREAGEGWHVSLHLCGECLDTCTVAELLALAESGEAIPGA